MAGFQVGLSGRDRTAQTLAALLQAYKEYMAFSVKEPPSQREFILNMEAKIKDPEFLGDTTAILRPETPYIPRDAYELVKTELLERI